MKRSLPLWLRVFILWLCVSAVGLTAPVWALVALVYLKWRRLAERADARTVAASLSFYNEGD